MCLTSANIIVRSWFVKHGRALAADLSVCVIAHMLRHIHNETERPSADRGDDDLCVTAEPD